MFPAVQAEEMAFAMTLFVSAASGQISIGREPLTLQNRHEGQRLFISLSSPTAEAKTKEEVEAALETALFRAFLIVWEHYRGDKSQASIAARTLGFYYLMGRSRGAALDRWVSSSPDETVALPPVVVEGIARVDLPRDGRLDEQAFLRTLEALAEHQPRSVEERPPLTPIWPVYEGHMASLVRAYDWSQSALGPVSQWPQSLRTAVDLALACRFPMVVLWGQQLVQIYNDGYCEIMDDRHPGGLGQPTRDCWPEVWSINQPIYARVLGGETLTFEDGLYPIKRNGHIEDAFFTLCYSPLRTEVGAIEGILVTVFETTDRVNAEMARQL